MSSFFPLTSSSSVQINDGTDTLAINTDGSLIGVACSVAANTTQANNNTQTIFTAGANGARVYAVQISTTGSNIAPSYISINGVRSIQVVAGTVNNSASLNFGQNYVSLAAGQTITITSTIAGNYASGSALVKDL